MESSFQTFWIPFEIRRSIAFRRHCDFVNVSKRAWMSSGNWLVIFEFSHRIPKAWKNFHPSCCACSRSDNFSRRTFLSCHFPHHQPNLPNLQSYAKMDLVNFLFICLFFFFLKFLNDRFHIISQISYNI